MFTSITQVLSGIDETHRSQQLLKSKYSQSGWQNLPAEATIAVGWILESHWPRQFGKLKNDD